MIDSDWCLKKMPLVFNLTFCHWDLQHYVRSITCCYDCSSALQTLQDEKSGLYIPSKPFIRVSP